MTTSARGFTAVLRNRHFLLLWLAQAISQIAQNGVNLVQIVLIETLTHSSGQIALMVLAFTLPA
ncbi:MAG: arabinose efflux permease, partial [Chloroflexi bacterium]|nr:arabinose efflux permease [Chloroflexota bacterium]